MYAPTPKIKLGHCQNQIRTLGVKYGQHHRNGPSALGAVGGYAEAVSAAGQLGTGSAVIIPVIATCSQTKSIGNRRQNLA
jgi:hypothetical protein